ncbi:MAG: polyamine aminopropyltransferase [Lachnospiraceae bacterium]|nr:polyamine aminopropyltransferase [Lachnospiraceae bacterium]
MKHNSELVFSDSQSISASLSISVTKQLYHGESEFQEIDVFDSTSFGKFLVLDGEVIFSESDEFIYNEMVVHVPMAVHPNVKKVLIIGGGDGGVAREFTHYPEIEQIDVVEPDEQMIEVCRQFFPTMAMGFEDPRVHVYNQDGLRFVRSRENEYDIIINDATDPFGHAEGLFTKEFYGSCYRTLKEDGIMVYQHGSPFFDEEESTFRSMHRKVVKTFPISRVYNAHVPTCVSGYWTFGFASKKYHPIDDFNPERWDERNIKTWYYTSSLHKASFMLPRYVVDILREEEGRN